VCRPSLAHKPSSFCYRLKLGGSYNAKIRPLTNLPDAGGSDQELDSCTKRLKDKTKKGGEVAKGKGTLFGTFHIVARWAMIKLVYELLSRTTYPIGLSDV